MVLTFIVCLSAKTEGSVTGLPSLRYIWPILNGCDFISVLLLLKIGVTWCDFVGPLAGDVCFTCWCASDVDDRL
jgi:hypothetical protein